MMKIAFLIFFLLVAFSARSQQTFNKLNVNDLSLPNETSGRALYIDGSNKVKASSSITSTELSYLDGLTDTLLNLLGAKEGSISAGTTSQYWRGDKSWQTLDKTAVGLANVQNLDQTNPANITQSSSYRFVSDTEKGTWDAKEPAISAGTTSQYWRGDKSWQTLDKASVGLSNVDNTSDTNKPVSTAQQAALDLKANLASPSLTGTPTAPTATGGTNTTQIATTAFVQTAVSGVVVSDATTSSKGIVQLAGDLGGTAASPTVPGLSAKADDSSVVHLAGTETITGAKSFSGKLTSSSTTFGNRLCPVMTNAQMLAVSSPAQGDCVYNSTAEKPYYYNSTSSSWVTSVAGAGASGHEVIVDTGNGHGSTNTKIRRFTNTRKNIGTAITYADSAANGGSFTINDTGVYTITYMDKHTSSDEFFAITVNDSAMTTNAGTPLTYAQGMRAMTFNVSTRVVCVSWTGNLTAGDVVRAHTNGSANATDGSTMFTIAKVSN
jgi:hypothetical protein